MRVVRLVGHTKDHILVSKQSLLVALILFSSVIICLYSLNSRYTFTNLDSISYLSIAQQYAEGHFSSAIDSYWSPFISWLIAITLIVGFNGPTGFALVNAGAGILALLLGILLVRRGTNNSFVMQSLFVVLATPFLMMATREFTPDLLVLTWVLAFPLVVLLSDKYLGRNQGSKGVVRAGLILGAFGALGFLIKMFLLFFFLAIIMLWAVYRFITEREGVDGQIVNRLRHSSLPLLASVVFLVIFMSPWVVAMSTKHGEIVIGSSFGRNTSNKFVEESPTKVEASNIQANPSLDVPYNEHATTHSQGRPPSFGKNEEAKLNNTTIINFIGYRAETTPNFIKTISKIWIFSIPIVVLALALLVLRKVSPSHNKLLVYLIASFLVYLAGYYLATIGPNPRYIWPVAPLAMVILAMLLYKLTARNSLLFVVLVFGTFAASMFFHGSWVDKDRILASAGTREEYRIADNFNYNTKGRIKDSKIAGNNARSLARIAYVLGAQSYGSINNTQDFTSDGVAKLLDRHKIDYFVHYVPKSDSEEQAGNIPTGSRLVATYTSDSYACRDVRYGALGEGLPYEVCIISLYQLKESQ